ncbi:hypothetical protein V9T40_007145 [Parthenolecanium corni]|uniref:Uncharacterized protein n=1 Tax=Parthenolecanium corni TaxID=536013 RepID=A0AAN9TUS1_9HEMI
MHRRYPAAAICGCRCDPNSFVWKHVMHEEGQEGLAREGDGQRETGVEGALYNNGCPLAENSRISASAWQGSACRISCGYVLRPHFPSPASPLVSIDLLDLARVAHTL